MRLDGVEREQREPAAVVTRAAEVPASPAFAKPPSDDDGRNWMLASAAPLANGGFESKDSAHATGDAIWGELASGTKSSRAIGIALVAVLLVVTVGFLLYHSRGTRASARAKDDPVPAAEMPPSPPADSAAEPAPAAAMPTVTPKSTESTTPRVPSHLVASGTVLQVGAMTHEAYAEALVKDLKQKNLPAFVFRREGDNFYRVAVGPFTASESPVKMKGDLEKQGFKPFLRPWSPNQQ
jgi:cell division protein FtsN